MKLRNFRSKWPWTQTKILLWACVETVVQTSLLYFYFYFNLKLYFFLLPPLAHPSPLITTSSTCRRSPPPPTNDTPFFSYLFFFFSPSILPTKLIFPFLHLLLHLTANQQHHACRCRSWRNLTELTMPAVAPIETHTSIFNFFFKKNNKKNKGREKEVILNKSFKKGQNAHLFG